MHWDNFLQDLGPEAFSQKLKKRKIKEHKNFSIHIKFHQKDNFLIPKPFQLSC